MGEETFESAVRAMPFLRDVPEGQEFVLSSGERVNSLLELQNMLISMEEGVFLHHVNPDKNDFAAWAYHSIGDQELAEQLGPLKTKAQNFVAVKNRVRHLVSQMIMPRR